MRTLSEIIEAAKSNQPATEEELRYALCAVDALAKFDEMDLMKLAEHQKNARVGQKLQEAWLRYNESFKRWKRALAADPKVWLGPNSDPTNPEYQHRRQIANRIFEAAAQGKLPTQVKQ